jgi:hypothetical protein
MRSREFADGKVGAALAEALMPEPWISASTPVTSEPISQLWPACAPPVTPVDRAPKVVLLKPDFAAASASCHHCS